MAQPHRSVQTPGSRSIPAACAVVITLILLIPLANCASTPQVPPPQTGVHLQAVFQIPTLSGGQEPSFSEMNYMLWFPEGYGEDPDRQWPLIFFLHGASPSDSGTLMSYGLPNVLYEGNQPDPFPFIVATPQAFTGVPWWQDDVPEILITLLDEIIETYQVDPDRIYLTGLSMGGYGSWYLATFYPDRFAAMVSVAGSGYHSRSVSPFAMCNMRDLPVWAIHGAVDITSAPSVSRQYYDALAECGGEVKWTLYPDADHRGTYTRAYLEPEVYAWMLEHSRQ